MIRFIVIFLGVASSGGFSKSYYVAAAVIPPPSGPRSPGLSGSDYQRNDDVPIIGENSILPDHPNKRSMSSTNRRRRSSRSQKNSTKNRNKNNGFDIESNNNNEDLPPFFFFGNRDDDHSTEQKIYERWFRHRHQQDHVDNRSDDDDTDHERETLAIGPSINSFRRWTYEKTGFYIPKINLHFEPITTLKLRKSWHNIIPGAIIRAGADFETQARLGTGVWRLRGCVEDKLIGGRIAIKGKRGGSGGALIQYSKSWLFPGAGNLATRFNLVGTYDIKLQRGSARFGFRTEHTNGAGNVGTPNIFSGMGRQGFTIIPVIPLDGPSGHMKLEAKTTIDLPEPEFVVGMDLDGVSVDGGSLGMGIGGDVDVEVEELNLIVNL